MATPALPELLERIVLVGVAITTRALTEAAPSYDLSFPQWRVLLVVGEGPDGAAVSEVSSRVGVTVPATSRQLHRLTRRGLIEMVRDQRDRRVVRARLTDVGCRVRDSILRYRQQRIAATTARLGVSNDTLRELSVVADALDVHR